MRRPPVQTAILAARKLARERRPDLGFEDRKAAKAERKAAKDERKAAEDERGQLQARIVELEESRDTLAQNQTQILAQLVDVEARLAALESGG